MGPLNSVGFGETTRNGNLGMLRRSRGSFVLKKRSRIRLQPVLEQARTEIPPLVAEVLLSFMARSSTPVHKEN
jgi:hypothetical protein